MVASEALGSEGREVRCGKCGHLWFQPGERDSLDELPPEEPGEFDIGFEPHVDKPEPPQPAPDILKPKAAQPPAAEPEKESIVSKKTAASVLAAFVLVWILAFILISARESIAKSSSFMAGAYEKLGLHLPKEEASIAVDRFKVVKDGKKLSASLYLINLTGEEVPVKKITAEMLDLDDKPMKSMDVQVPESTIKGESQSKVEFSFEDAPKDAVSIKVKVAQ